MHLKRTLPFIAVLFLGACEQNTEAKARYECDDGTILNATFTNGEKVTIETDDQTFTIGRAEAASGTKYESDADGVSFWSKGIDALFVSKPGAAPLKCRRS